MDRAQRRSEQNRVMCLIIMLIPKSLSLKCPKWPIVFSADGSKNKSQFGQIHMKNPNEFFQDWYTLWLLLSQQKNTETQHFQGSISC